MTVIQTALIKLSLRADEPIFGRPLLERLLIVCRRAGISQFFVEALPAESDRARLALGSFRDDPSVQLVPSFKPVAALHPMIPCVRFSGDLVLAQSQLLRALDEYLAHPGKPLRIRSADHDHAGAIVVGPMGAILQAADMKVPPPSDGAANANSSCVDAILPFALNGRVEDRDEAESRLARAVREESASTDALMARMVDRRLSWRISLRLARTRITPNQITFLNTAIGFGCAALMASTSYWLRLGGAVLFLLCITLDGVDGELARLRMLESRFGARLDVLTDNLVHVAIFAGIAVGCYRLSNSSSYFYVLAVLLGGFGACALSVNRALSMAGEEAQRWLSRVERATGRDFAYILFILAIFDRLYYFIWGAAVGTHIFAWSLWWLTNRYQKRRATAGSAAASVTW
jgi:phosphatidylglycerophosphate synthase